ncbi:MAG: hypothetical protein MK074_10015 [Phycisphaerales bacterium]|nr:hypothetical protein [Phycisphaerales bacterium]
MTYSIPLLIAANPLQLQWSWVFLAFLILCSLIGGVYALKSNERIKREEQITKRDAIQKVSEGKLSVEDADKLVNPKKRWFD